MNTMNPRMKKRPVILENDLPRPDQIGVKEPYTRVTINLQASNIAYFKREAKKHGARYQKLIRDVLALYVAKAARSSGGIGFGGRKARGVSGVKKAKGGAA